MFCSYRAVALSSELLSESLGLDKAHTFLTHNDVVDIASDVACEADEQAQLGVEARALDVVAVERAAHTAPPLRVGHVHGAVVLQHGAERRLLVNVH